MDSSLNAELLEELDSFKYLGSIVCKWRKFKVNVGQSKVMVCRRTERGRNLDLSLNGEILEEVDSFKYLGSILSKNGGVVEDMISRVNEGAKVSGALSRIWKVWVV